MNDVFPATQQQRALLKVEDAIATITLNRPDGYNSIDIEMAACLSALALQVEQMTDVQVLIIRGAGKAFCAGGDISFFIEHAANLAPPITELLTHLNTFLLTLQRMPAVVITSVHGVAAGAGFSIAFMGDYCIAATDARFRPAYAALGVSPDAGGSYILVKAVGPRQALALLLESEISCQRALALGLVSREVEAAQIEQATLEFARQLAQFSPQALASTKKLVWRERGAALQQQLDAELAEMLACMETSQFQDNIRRFAQARNSAPR